jgi:uncharacterized repeat protein (TIGR01451 family)
VIDVGERLIVAYRTQLDSGTQYNTPLTNVAGATQWYNAPSWHPLRTTYTRALTNGTVGVVDHEDAHTVTVVALLYADKAAALQVDGSSPGIVDAGDVLRYTIRVYNNGSLPLTQAVLRDAVPANTTYVADSMTLNGLPVGRPDGGVSPLVAGVDVSSSNLTPPLPGAGAGTLSPGQSAIVQFDLRVNDGVPPGTVIANQALVYTAELPNLLTDGDGNPATGPEPTVVVVGNLQEVRITKNVSVVGGGPAIAGATLEYVVQATNVGTIPAYQVVIRDDIAVPQPGYLTFVDQSWSLNGFDDGYHARGHAADRRLLDYLWRAAAGPRCHAALPRRAGRESCDRDARDEYRHGLLGQPCPAGERNRGGSTSAAFRALASSTAASGTTPTSTTYLMRTSSRSPVGTWSCI